MAGKYKKPFEKLKQQLKEELEEYLRLFVLDGLQFRDDDEGRQLVDEINRAFREGRSESEWGGQPSGNLT